MTNARIVLKDVHAPRTLMSFETQEDLALMLPTLPRENDHIHWTDNKVYRVEKVIHRVPLGAISSRTVKQEELMKAGKRFDRKDRPLLIILMECID